MAKAGKGRYQVEKGGLRPHIAISKAKQMNPRIGKITLPTKAPPKGRMVHHSGLFPHFSPNSSARRKGLAETKQSKRIPRDGLEPGRKRRRFSFLFSW
jgi:hypothetical protein